MLSRNIVEGILFFTNFVVCFQLIFFSFFHHRMRQSNRKTFILTNSDFLYTDVSYLGFLKIIDISSLFNLFSLALFQSNIKIIV